MENGSGVGILAGLVLAVVVFCAVAIGERSPIGGTQWSYALSSGSPSSAKGGSQ